MSGYICEEAAVDQVVKAVAVAVNSAWTWCSHPTYTSKTVILRRFDTAFEVAAAFKGAHQGVGCNGVLDVGDFGIDWSALRRMQHWIRLSTQNDRPESASFWVPRATPAPAGQRSTSNGRHDSAPAKAIR